MVVALGHPNRLPILIALEAQPRTLGELMQAIGVSRGTAKHAIKILTDAGLVIEVGPPVVTRNLVSLRYGTPFSGWASILDATKQVAASRKPVARQRAQ